MVPKQLQSVLWSVDTNSLDLEKDREYIIHQILAYGTWENIAWLLHTYGKDQVKEVFIRHPAKDYYPSGFKFVSQIVLDVGDEVDFQKYDRFAPRVIG